MAGMSHAWFVSGVGHSVFFFVVGACTSGTRNRAEARFCYSPTVWTQWIIEKRSKHYGTNRKVQRSGCLSPIVCFLVGVVCATMSEPLEKKVCRKRPGCSLRPSFNDWNKRGTDFILELYQFLSKIRSFIVVEQNLSQIFVPPTTPQR